MGPGMHHRQGNALTVAKGVCDRFGVRLSAFADGTVAIVVWASIWWAFV